MRKTCRSGNREMETDLCKPQNFTRKSVKTLAIFTTNYFPGLKAPKAAPGDRKITVFVHYAQKPRKAAQKLWKVIRNFFAVYCCPDGRRFRTFGIRPYGLKSCEPAVPDIREFETNDFQSAYAKRSKKSGISITRKSVACRNLIDIRAVNYASASPGMNAPGEFIS